jgi:hypothetical protein
MPTAVPYACRMCGAASYRKLTHRAPDGTMSYSGLYRCSGCSVTFADPTAWRGEPAALEGLQSASAAEPVGSSPRPPPGQYVPPAPPLESTWGTHIRQEPPPGTYGYSEEDCKAIKEAAERAGKGKHKGRRN